MIKPVREAAGLGCPTAECTTNASESDHAALKNYLPKDNQCSWQEFVEKTLQFVEDHPREIEMAILNRGQYQFKSQYFSLAVGDKWFKLNKGQQEAHRKKLYTQKLQYDPGSPDESTSVSSSEVVADSIPSSSKANTALSVNCVTSTSSM